MPIAPCFLTTPWHTELNARCWYHWIGLKKDINRFMFWFFNFDHEYLRGVQSYEPLHTKNESNLLHVGITVCLESSLPIGCCPFICWKNPPKWFSMLVRIADCWFPSNILLTSRNSKNNCCPLPHFWSTVWRKRLRFVHIQSVITTGRMIRGIFVWSGSELWSLFRYSRSKSKNQKHIAVDVLFKAYPMMQLSGWSNLAGRYL